jgi:hypothetical protein
MPPSSDHDEHQDVPSEGHGDSLTPAGPDLSIEKKNYLDSSELKKEDVKNKMHKKLINLTADDET